MKLNLGKWTERTLDDLLKESSSIHDVSARIEFVSGQFLDTGYQASTLIGAAETPEIFVVNLSGVDCFTFLEYVEAMRLSVSYDDFIRQIRNIRYRDGTVTFEDRNHFFTDWTEYNNAFVRDVTLRVGGQQTRKTTKRLNLKEDGTFFLPGIRPRRRDLHYVPAGAITERTLRKTRTGDYAGFYADVQGLDVSHVGIVIKQGREILLRHASCDRHRRKVVDEDLMGCVSDKPGLIVLRPRSRAVAGKR